MGDGWTHHRRAAAAVDGQEGYFVDLGAEDSELSAIGWEGKAAITRRELHVIGEEGIVAGEGDPEREPVPSLDLGIAAGREDAVLVVSLSHRCEKRDQHHHRRWSHIAADLFLLRLDPSIVRVIREPNNRGFASSAFPRGF